MASLQIQSISLRVRRRGGWNSGCGNPKSLDHPDRDLILEGKQIVRIALEALGPYVVSVRRANELVGDTQTVAYSANASLQYRLHVQPFSNGSDVLVLAVELKGGRSRHHLERGDFGQVIQD